MPADKWHYRPAAGMFKNEKPEFGLADVPTFAEQVKHVACSNFAFAAELDGNKPPEACLRDSFVALRKSLSAITAKNMYDPIEGPCAGSNTRVGLAAVRVWRIALLGESRWT